MPVEFPGVFLGDAGEHRRSKKRALVAAVRKRQVSVVSLSMGV